VKLQPDSQKQLIRIICGTSICTAAMWVLFAALHLVGWVNFGAKVIVSSLAGALVAVGNFAGICYTVQKAIDDPDEKHRKALIKASYNFRMLLQAVWVLVAIAAPCFQPFAGILPLLFPRVTIYYLQITGKYQPQKPQSASPSEADDPEGVFAAEDAPGGKGGET